VLVQESVTAGDGSYRFSGPGAGAFAVEVVNSRFEQVNVTTATLSVVLPGANLDIGTRQRAAIGGRVYRNDTGVAWNTVPVNAIGMANFTVTLRNSAGIVSVVRSDVSGFYLFDTLPVGEYEIEVRGPDGFTAVGGVNSRAVVLVAGGALNGVNFGFRLGESSASPAYTFYMPILYLLSPTK
jgi:hypothetical protein